MKVGRGIFARCSLHGSAYPDLAFQFRPIKAERRLRIHVELLALLAFVVGEETEAMRIHTFEQNNAHGWFSVRRRGREAHCVDVANVGGKCSSKPGAELLDRIRMKIGAA